MELSFKFIEVVHYTFVIMGEKKYLSFYRIQLKLFL